MDEIIKTTTKNFIDLRVGDKIMIGSNYCEILSITCSEVEVVAVKIIEKGKERKG